ncbi:MAG: hypothetical protein ACOH5I_26140 [Oligoflexus sp.]
MAIKKNQKTSKATRKSTPMAITKIIDKELELDSKTIKSLEDYLAKNGGEKAGLTLSDVVAHLLLEEGPNGFKFTVRPNEIKKVKLSLPVAAWDIAEKSQKKSGDPDLSEVIKALANRI